MAKTKESPTAVILGGKKKSRGKGKAVKEQDDYLAAVVMNIENLEGEEVLVQAREIADSVERNYFRLGGLLDRIHAESLFQNAGYNDFGDYVADTFGFRRSKALYLVQIYNALIEAEVNWAQAKDLTWCKLRMLAQVIDKKNASKWIKHARGVSVAKLADQIKGVVDKRRDAATTGGTESGRAVGGNGQSAPAEQVEAGSMTSLSFRLFGDQVDVIEAALAKAQEEGDTKSKATALYYICTSYLHDGKVIRVSTKGKSLVDQMRGITPEVALDAFTQAHPKFHVTVTSK